MDESLRITLDPELAARVRQAALTKFGNMRSSSKLVEELVKAGLEALEKPVEACSVLGVRSDHSFRAEARFNETVERITHQLGGLRELCTTSRNSQNDWYFALKEAYELNLNRHASTINECWNRSGLNGPLPIYPDAGKNFVLYASLDNMIR